MSFSDKPSVWSRLFGRNRARPEEWDEPAELHDAVETPRKRTVVSGQSRQAPRRDVSMPSFSSRPRVDGFDGQSGNAMKRLRHAFTPSHPVANSRLFAGRRQLLEKIVSLLEDQHLHLVLYGDRGIGKTSIMRIIAELAKDADYYVSYTSCGKDTEFDSLIRGIAKRIPLLYHDDYDPTDSAVEEGETLESLFHEGKVTVADATAIFEHLHGTQFLFLLDEFDRVASSAVREQIAELIKNLSDRGVPIQLVIAGVASNLTALFSHIPSIRRNLIGMPITRLNEKETEQLLELGAYQSSLTFGPRAKAMIIRWSYGLPYIAQLVALHASIAAIRRGSKAVEIQDVDVAGQEAEVEIGLRLSEGTRTLIENEIRDWKFEALGNLALAAIHGNEHLPEEALARLGAQNRAALILEDDGDAQFREEAAIPYILMLARHLEKDQQRGVVAH